LIITAFSLSRYKKLIWFYLVRAEVVSSTLPLFFCGNRFIPYQLGSKNGNEMLYDDGKSTIYGFYEFINS